MKVRIFLPADETLQQFPYGEFDFDVMPQEGNVLRFTDFEGAEYPVERVGFIQDGERFVGAVWLDPPRPLTAMVESDEAIELIDEKAGEAKRQLLQ